MNGSARERGGAGGPMEGWVIVQSNGLTLIGRMGEATDEGYRLSPVYEMKPAMRPSRDGRGVEVTHTCVPVWLLGLESIDVPLEAIVVACESLSRPQRAMLAQYVAQAAEIQESQKRAESPVLLVPAGVPLPKPPGRQ